MQEKSEIVKAQIEEILKARGEFFAELDRQVPKVAGTDVFDFAAVKAAVWSNLATTKIKFETIRRVSQNKLATKPSKTQKSSFLKTFLSLMSSPLSEFLSSSRIYYLVAKFAAIS